MTLVRKPLIIFLTTLFLLTFLPTTFAHTDGKIKPKITLSKLVVSPLVREYTIKLTDSDSPESIDNAKITISGLMKDPHEMTIESTNFQKLKKPGEYKVHLMYPMGAKWFMTIKVSGPALLKSQTTLTEDLIAQVKPVKQAQTLPVKAKETDFNWISLINQSLHLIFTVLWIGGYGFVITQLKFSLPKIAADSKREFLADLMKRYSALSILSALVLIATGIYNTIFGAPASLPKISNLPFGSLYLGILVTKILLVVLIVFIGAYIGGNILPKLNSTNSKEEDLAATTNRLFSIMTVNFGAGITILVLTVVLQKVHMLTHGM